MFARNLRARIDNGLYVRTLKDLRNVHEQSHAQCTTMKERREQRRQKELHAIKQ